MSTAPLGLVGFTLPAFEFERPLGLAALVLPALLLWLLRRPARPPLVATGTLALWRAAAGAQGARGRLRRGLPPRVLLAALALALASLALAGPRTLPRQVPVAWVYLDRSPSLFLPWGPGEATRLERALELAFARLEPLRRQGGRVRWITFQAGGRLEHEGDRPPMAWRRRPAAPAPEPPWRRLDHPGALWVTDRAPSALRRHAALIASGGAAVPGPVAAEGRRRILWDGEGLVEATEHAPAQGLWVDPRAPAEVRTLAELFARERELDLDRGSEPALEIAFAGPAAGAPSVTAWAARDGWRVRGRIGPSGAGTAPGNPWLVAEGVERREASEEERPAVGTALVRAAPGRIVWALAGPLALEGDPAAFALSLARLLDASLLPPPDVVPLSERLAAEPAAGDGEPPLAVERRGGPWPLEALLAAAAAALLGIAALAPSPPRGPRGGQGPGWGVRARPGDRVAGSAEALGAVGPEGARGEGGGG